MNYFCTIDEAISEIKKGRMLILVDSPGRENEGDLYIPADKVTPKAIFTMIRSGGGLICCAITAYQAARLNLPLMVSPLENQEKTGVNFTVSVNAAKGISTGVSADDRAKSIKVLADPKSSRQDLVKPGHTFGLVAQDGGVLVRAGHTEAAVDLAKLAGFNPAGVLCEIVRSDGRMAQLRDLIKLSYKLAIKIVSIDDLTEYLKKNPLPKPSPVPLVASSARAKLPTPYGLFQILIYRSMVDQGEHTVLLKGSLKQPVLTRIHSQCLTGETFSSLRCDCGAQLDQSLQRIGIEGGVLLYLNQEGRGIGLANKINAYSLQDRGVDTVEANLHLGFPIDARDYQVAADILKDLGISQIMLLTNNPKKEAELEKFGIQVDNMQSLEIPPNRINRRYLLAKKQKLGHKLTNV